MAKIWCHTFWTLSNPKLTITHQTTRNCQFCSQPPRQQESPTQKHTPLTKSFLWPAHTHKRSPPPRLCHPKSLQRPRQHRSTKPQTQTPNAAPQQPNTLPNRKHTNNTYPVASPHSAQILQQTTTMSDDIQARIRAIAEAAKQRNPGGWVDQAQVDRTNAAAASAAAKASAAPAAGSATPAGGPSAGAAFEQTTQAQPHGAQAADFFAAQPGSAPAYHQQQAGSMNAGMPAEQQMYNQDLQQGNTYYYGNQSGQIPQQHGQQQQYGQQMHIHGAGAGAPQYPPAQFGGGPPRGSAAPASGAPCHFFAKGNCTRGSSCRYSHDVAAADSKADVEASQGKECGICLDVVVDCKRQFGLLTECDHVYCLDCIRNWRHSSMSDFENTKSLVRMCPQCRVVSYLVIPSDVLVHDPVRKLGLLAAYKQRLSGIPCKNFDRGQGSCPFGDSCMYLHALDDGTVVRPKVRVVASEGGNFLGPKVATLGDVLLANARKRR
jgi:hypothetical protein